MVEEDYDVHVHGLFGRIFLVEFGPRPTITVADNDRRFNRLQLRGWAGARLGQAGVRMRWGSLVRWGSRGDAGLGEFERFLA